MPFVHGSVMTKLSLQSRILTFFGLFYEKQVTLERAQWLEDGGLLESDSGSKAPIP